MFSRFRKALFSRKTAKDILEHQQEVADINDAYARLFNTDDGKFVLDHLIKINMTAPIASRGDNLLDIGVKQGRSNVVNEIVQRVVRS